MPKTKNSLSVDRVRHRFVCQTCGKRGKWQDDDQVAIADGRKHQQNASGLHVIIIETEQRSSQALH
jgi:hypothetical protein